jgi:aryl-alcohol dehydrogenase-like predicted oxidoreductase
MAKTLGKVAHRRFSSTGQSVSILGLGTVKFGRNQGVKYPSGDGFPLPTEAEISSLLDLCLDQGINLLDTAPAYGTAEERLGALLGKRRKDFFLVTKTGEEFDKGKSSYHFTAEHTRASVMRSLARLKTDYLDCVLVHANKDDLFVINQTPVLAVLAELKAENKILSFGVSTTTLEGGRRAVDLCDAVMVSYNQSYTAERPVIDYAHEMGKAVLVKKGLASGHINTLGGLEDNLKFVLETTGVTSLVFGSLSAANIMANIRALKNII